jgi:group I intron endonuclease
MEAVMHYLYRITNQVNGKVYIGQSKNPRKRWAEHKYSAAPHKKTSCMLITRAIKKHNVENFIFKVIDIALNYWQADCLEINYINQYDSRNPEKGYNIHIGGNSVMLNRKHSEETKQKMRNHKWTQVQKDRISNSRKGILNNRFGKKLSEETKKKIGLSNKNKLILNIPVNKGKYKLSEQDISLVKTMTYQEAHDKFGLSSTTIWKYKRLQ